jgi:hypothetical protein
MESLLLRHPHLPLQVRMVLEAVTDLKGKVKGLIFELVPLRMELCNLPPRT